MNHVLLSVVGLTPQVITETLYALHAQEKQVDEIHVITTREGKEKILALLLAEGSGALYRYLDEYDMEAKSTLLSVNNIHVLTNEHGDQIDEITAEEDNERLLYLCLSLTFNLTKDPNTAVYFSVAGGRKTMTSCLTLAAQLYGRPQDRLYHTLVSSDFENTRDFFYPPLDSKHIELVDEQGERFYKDAKLAKIHLVPIPFFSLRTMLPSEMLSEVMEPAALISSLIREEEKRILEIDLKEGKVCYRGLECDMPPTQLALYLFFARRKKDCSSEHHFCAQCNQCYIEWQEISNNRAQVADIYSQLPRAQAISDMSDSGIKNLTQENFNSYKTKIHKTLLNAFGRYALKDLDIQTLGKRPDTKYGIGIEKTRIVFTE